METAKKYGKELVKFAVMMLLFNIALNMIPGAKSTFVSLSNWTPFGGNNQQ